MQPRYAIRRNPNTGQYHVRFEGGNREVVWWTESYTTKASANAAIAFARTHAASAPVVDLT